MTVNAETAKSGPYSGNGSTTVFAYAFKALDQAHLVVTSTVTATGVETVQELTTHYTVSGVGDDGGGNFRDGLGPWRSDGAGFPRRNDPRSYAACVYKHIYHICYFTCPCR